MDWRNGMAIGLTSGEQQGSVPFEKCGKHGTKDAESRYSTAHRADSDEFMFWSVHDHSDGRNRARARADGAVERGGGLHVHRERPGRVQVGAFVAAHDVVGAGEGAGVHGTPGHRPRQLLHQQFGADAG